MSKYKQCFDEMLKQNSQLFESFRAVHDNFLKNPKKYKKEFDEIGRDVQDVIRRYENRLCGSTESAGYSKYSANLAEKFHQEIKTHFPKIDHIGLE